MTQHTELPWFVHDFTQANPPQSSVCEEVTISCDHPATITVATMARGLTATIEEARANAHFIAEACNNYDLQFARIAALIERNAALEKELAEAEWDVKVWKEAARRQSEDLQSALATITAECDRAREERDELERDRGGWVPGAVCATCKGCGLNNEGVSCQSCAGTGEVWMTWKDRAANLLAERDKAVKDEREACIADCQTERDRPRGKLESAQWSEGSITCAHAIERRIRARATLFAIREAGKDNAPRP